MGYDVLSKVIELTDTSEPIERRLESVARLIIRTLPFNAFDIYSWEPGKKLFRLSASFGKERVRKKTYSPKEGMAGRARKLPKIFDVTIKDPEKPVCFKIEDAGMTGFRYARVYPLNDGKKLYGVLYLKASVKPVLSQRKKQMLAVVARQLTASLRCERDFARLKKTLNELKDVQTRLMNAEKLMALGELSATLAHEIRNPLVSIGGFAALLVKKIGPDSPYQNYVVQIVKEVAKLEGLINDILHVTEDRGLRFSAEELNPIVDDALGLFVEVRRRRRIEIKKNMTTKKINVFADSQQLKIAFDNLISNAIQSMRKGGVLSIKTQKLKDWGVVSITDNGGGIEPSLISDIFNPFFTTKRKGTGLGLPITHKIITRHKGLLEVKNDYGRGMTFIVKLPLQTKTRTRKKHY